MISSANGKFAFNISENSIKDYKYKGIPTDRVTQRYLLHSVLRDNFTKEKPMGKIVKKSFGAEVNKIAKNFSSKYNEKLNKYLHMKNKKKEIETSQISVYNNSVENNNTNMTQKNNSYENSKKINTFKPLSKRYVNWTSRGVMKSSMCNNSPKVSSIKAKFLQSDNIKFFLKNKSRSNINDLYSNLAKKLKEIKGNEGTNFTFSNCNQAYSKISISMRVANEIEIVDMGIINRTAHGESYCIFDTSREEEEEQIAGKIEENSEIKGVNYVSKVGSQNIRRKIITYDDKKPGERRRISSFLTKNSGTSKNTKDTSGSTVRSMNNKLIQKCFVLDSPEEMHFLNVKIRMKFSKQIDKVLYEAIKEVDAKEDMVSIVAPEEDML